MKKRRFLMFSLFTVLMLSGCHAIPPMQHNQKTERINADEENKEGEGIKEGETTMNASLMNIVPTEKITDLEDGFSAVCYEGNYGFDEFLSRGGASSDREVIGYLAENLLGNLDLQFIGEIFGCSTVTVQDTKGKVFFGRNFDWNTCEAMVVASYPEDAYASISTVNMDFIRQGADGAAGLALKSDKVRTIAALYAPLDGMNEKGLAVSVNMIQDSAAINQNTEKPDITTTTAIRLLLDKAGTVEEALALLDRYDMHASMGMMVHFALADADGKSVAVEYVGNEMVVTKTPVLTNFYLAQGEKNGIGTTQSHTRYDMLMERLEEKEAMDMEDVRDALSSVSKGNFGEFESTEWSIVFNQTGGQAVYYHRENYEQGYAFALK